MLNKLLKKMFARTWYCKKCDQRIGTGKRPDQCRRCGSNRLTTKDPMKGR